MKILTINCGSQSIKYKLFDMPQNKTIKKGNINNIGFENKKYPDHETAINDILNKINKKIDGIGHRIVHGGEYFQDSIILDKKNIKIISKNNNLAPLHNPQNILGIQICKKLLPNIPQIGVFDTAFHQSMPKENYTYPIPQKFYKKYKIRRYGFHGTSHKYVSQIAIENLNSKKIISCHIGNGASITAIQNGKVIKTSMGLTPLEGLVMGTRSGNLDPSIITFLIEKENLSTNQIDKILNNKSGLLGLTGTNNMKNITQGYIKKNTKKTLAFKIYMNSIIEYIGAYIALLNGADTIILTGGVMEKPKKEPLIIREYLMKKLNYLGIEINKEANDIKGKKYEIITKKQSKIKVAVIPTNEELIIAQDTYNLINRCK